ncbi:MAG: hypothetical protein N3A00_00720 [Thermodesulfovibrio sp.]|nr:hypothetical protein [Thermodesulfovibrio sp.]
MKIELGLRAGIALPLLTTLIIGMSILVGFNYISQLNTIKEQEIREIETAINSTNIFLETTPLYQKILSITINNPNVFENYLNLEKLLNKLKRAVNSEIGLIIKKNLLSEELYKKSSKNTFGEWVSVFFTGNEPKAFLSEQSINKISQMKDKYSLEEISKEDKDYFIIYIPIKDSSDKIFGYIYLTKERILSTLTTFKILGINILAYIGILILISILIGYGMNKYVINPIIALTNAADNISMGKTSEKVQIENAKGEIAVLAKSIERMRITMKKLLE